MATHRSSTLAVTINRPWREVYEFAAEPANMVQWAAGLGNGFEGAGLKWIARDPGGNPIRITFSEKNAFGVLDHDVHLDDRVVHVALRVMPNGDGAEVTFLLLQENGMSEAEYQRDAAAVRKDLETLKALMEKGA
ncbi:SRPBCC family protein [Devosia sp.]|uniref:SRPBCC family protein n=1 Tax=Devosia sp. TaxID=1871048 RepID=UPI001AD4AE14|nr:SRPBCC family protein [Devosia sp.]MBN9332194.1 SRPBCC family protein [Devosia sp.]